MADQKLNYHLQKMHSYMGKLKQSGNNPAMHQKYMNKVRKHWLLGYQHWHQMGRPFLQFNPFVQVNPSLDLNMQTQINPNIDTEIHINPYFNFDPSFEINIGNKNRRMY